MPVVLGMIFKSQTKLSLPLRSHPWFSKSELIFFFFGYTSGYKPMSHWSLKSYIVLVYFQLVEGKTLLLTHCCTPATWHSVLCMWRTWDMSAEWTNEWMSGWVSDHHMIPCSLKCASQIQDPLMNDFAYPFLPFLRLIIAKTVIWRKYLSSHKFYINYFNINKKARWMKIIKRKKTFTFLK